MPERLLAGQAQLRPSDRFPAKSHRQCRLVSGSQRPGEWSAGRESQQRKEQHRSTKKTVLYYISVNAFEQKLEYAQRKTYAVKCEWILTSTWCVCRYALSLTWLRMRTHSLPLYPLYPASLSDKSPPSSDPRVPPTRGTQVR